MVSDGSQETATEEYVRLMLAFSRRNPTNVVEAARDFCPDDFRVPVRGRPLNERDCDEGMITLLVVLERERLVVVDYDENKFPFSFYDCRFEPFFVAWAKARGTELCFGHGEVFNNCGVWQKLAKEFVSWRSEVRMEEVAQELIVQYAELD